MPLSDFPRLNTPPSPQQKPFTQWNVPQGHQFMGYFHSIFFNCSAIPQRPFITYLWASDLQTDVLLSIPSYYTLFSGHCYFLTFRLCCFGIFQGKYYESSLKLKMFQSSNYTLEVPVHNGHLWLFLQGHLPDSPKGGRIKIPPNTLCLHSSGGILPREIENNYLPRVYYGDSKIVNNRVIWKKYRRTRLAERGTGSRPVPIVFLKCRKTAHWDAKKFSKNAKTIVATLISWYFKIKAGAHPDTKKVN